jgi:hypothetical protein
MEIIKYTDKLIIKEEYNKWINFHSSKKIVSENVIEKIKEYYCEDYESYQKDNFTYCIQKINNNKIVGIFLYDNDYISISNLILSPEEDWYNMFEIIIKYVLTQISKERQINYVQIDSVFMEHHEIIDKILKDLFNNIVITNRKGKKKWDIMLFDIDAKFDNKYIEIIMYKDYTKKNIINTFISRFIIFDNKFIDECGCNNEMSYLIFENILETFKENEDQPIDINFEINGNKYKNTESNSYKILSYNRPRLNKLRDYKGMYVEPQKIYISGFKIPIKINTDGNYKHKIETKKCKDHKSRDYTITNEHYCLHQFIYNDINLKTKKIKNIDDIYIPTKIKSCNEKCIVCDLEIYDISQLFIEEDNNQIKNTKKINKIKKVNKNNEAREEVKELDDSDEIKNTNGHVYLLQMRDAHDNIIYKIGQTTRLNPCDRINEYGPSKKIIFLKEVNDSKKTEFKFKEILKNDVNIKKYVQGNEYFTCNDKKYITQLLINIE